MVYETKKQHAHCRTLASLQSKKARQVYSSVKRHFIVFFNMFSIVH